MAISTELRYAELDELLLDPLNPRLGRNNTGVTVTQEAVLELMRDWTLDELALSYLESGGFWTQEALIVVEEEAYGDNHLIVVEGNRRLAALKHLRQAVEGHPASKKWAQIAESGVIPKDLFSRIPYLLADSRRDVQAFLGFRHVTGIKEWRPAEKAEFISGLIDQGMSYDEVRRKIGSKTPTVRQNYIAFQLLIQIENTIPEVPEENFEDRFSVMYLSLRTRGVQAYLNLDIQVDPQAAQNPVPRERETNLANYARWIFGNKDMPPLFTDSRRIDDFGTILLSDEAVAYLERTDRPSFEVAFRTAGGDESELVRLIEQAADNVELSLSRAHLYIESEGLRKAVRRFGADAQQLLRVFPEIRDELERASTR
jgi:hypothetical protein